jgi:hypothetical protein
VARKQALLWYLKLSFNMPAYLPVALKSRFEKGPEPLRFSLGSVSIHSVVLGSGQ